MSPRRPTGPLNEGALAALAGLARREGHGDAPAGADARGRERVLRGLRSTTAAPPPSARATALWLAAAALACLVAVTLVLVLSPRAPLGFTVDGVAAAAGAYVHAPGAGPGATVRFTDGSEVAFTAGAGGHVAEVDPRGARVLLEAGTASFTIAHRPGARWSVEAGPFTIAVIGTTFDATWSAEAQTLEVRLRAGEVAVVGPLAPHGIHLRAGQQLTARVAQGEILIGELPAVTSPPTHPTPISPAATASPPAATALPIAPPPSAPASSPAVVGAPPSPPAAAAPSAPRPLGWSRRVAAGDFLAVVADAEARGVEGALRQVSLVDLVALADAARYAGRGDLARRALLAERARFTGSAEARAAAFLLGRLADDAGGSPDAAIRWYDAYLDEAPSGAFAAEALGRKLAARRRAGDPAARAAAAEYLHHYPEGPYAAAARELLVAP